MESTVPTPSDALKEACRRAGNQTALAKKLGRTKATISRWIGQQVPAEICPDIEDLTGVFCEQLRPDVNWSVLRRSNRRTGQADRRTGPADRRNGNTAKPVAKP